MAVAKEKEVIKKFEKLPDAMPASERLENVANEALGLLWRYLHGDIVGSDQVRISVMLVSSWQKQIGSQTHRDQLQYIIDRTMAADREELKSLLKRTLPKYCPPALLQGTATV